MIRVLITDDHLVVREGLHLILETADDIEVVGEAVEAPSACVSSLNSSLTSSSWTCKCRAWTASLPSNICVKISLRLPSSS